MSRSVDFPCVEDIEMKRQRLDASDGGEHSMKQRVEMLENNVNASVMTSFSVTCQIIDIEGTSNERAHLKFTVIPRVVSSPLSNVTSIPYAFRTNCLNQYPGFRTKPIYVGLLPYVQSWDELVMEYVGPITNDETQEVGNVVLRQTKEYGSDYSDTDLVMDDEFHAFQSLVSADDANRFEHYKNSYSAMVGHTLVIKLNDRNFERITAIGGLIDYVVANAIVGIYARLGEVLDYYEQQFSTQESTNRKIGWVNTFGDISMERSNAVHSSFSTPGLLNQPIDDHMGIFINKFRYQGYGVFYVAGEYIVEERHMSQKHLPLDPNDLYNISSTNRIQLPFELHAPSFAWPVTPDVAGASSNSEF